MLHKLLKENEENLRGEVCSTFCCLFHGAVKLDYSHFVPLVVGKLEEEGPDMFLLSTLKHLVVFDREERVAAYVLQNCRKVELD